LSAFDHDVAAALVADGIPAALDERTARAAAAEETGMECVWLTVDGNEAAANIAYQLSEIVAIYPITPSSAMGESADAWAAQQRLNIWGSVPRVVEMQSEGGAAGALHGALQSGTLATTFTASQGLLLMIPNMFKIAGELTPAVMHVSARAIATHALSIFGDHSDVMAVRGTGWAMLCSGSVQEAQDFAAIAHAATLATRVPFLHFFDGFRTSHEVGKIRALETADLRLMVPETLVHEHRRRALSPDRPVIRGTAQNPDVFFQSREAASPYYDACGARVQHVMNSFAALTGRQYRLFDYTGSPDADRVIVAMGSATGAIEETVRDLAARGEGVGLLRVRLFRPFDSERFIASLPPTTRTIAVLDRTKEPGSVGEPLYQDVVTALDAEIGRGGAWTGPRPRVIGGRFGLGSKEFTPAMAKAVFDLLRDAAPRPRFTVGITDDVSLSSIDYDRSYSTEKASVVRAILFGLGSDGTVGAAKNTIKIIGDETDLFAQGYFVYDSKKSGSITVSHLRFGPDPIDSTYLIDRAGFIACHQWDLLERIDVLEHAEPGGIFLLNCPYEDAWDRLPDAVQRVIRSKQLKLYVIDACAVAEAAGMGRRVNTVLQTCFFQLAGILPAAEAIAAIKRATQKTYGAKGAAVVERNFAAIEAALDRLTQVTVPADDRASIDLGVRELTDAPAFVPSLTAALLAGQGDALPVSAFPVDGTFPVGTARFEKRNLADRIPVWDETTCIQCNKCIIVCPHAAIRVKAYEPGRLAAAPQTFKAVDYKGSEYAGMKYSIQVAPEDCTGCQICVEICPAKDRQSGLRALEMSPQAPLRSLESENFRFFLDLPEVDRTITKAGSVKGSQFLQPLFEFSGACAGCGETPYIKLVTQLFGDRMVVANATGCSSIFGGNLPTTPWTTNRDGRGPAWANSLFEDNAEFGYGMRLAIDAHAARARQLLRELAPLLGGRHVDAILSSRQENEAEIREQRLRITELRGALEAIVRVRDTDGAWATLRPQARRLASLVDHLVKKSVWIIGGDGWAYDIGYGGLDHVLASGANVNVLVLDTEVYSNTGGQMSKSTPLGAVAKFAAAGKRRGKKNLGLLAMTYGSVYVAQIALGGNDTQR
jgi:pyruvate-ferredoxin/flavodoxin oxidoreductase